MIRRFGARTKAPGQIVKCAEADALRATFPTLLGGLYSGDELRMNETISSVISADSPAGAPTFIEAGKGEQRAIPAESEPVKQTSQSELEAIVLGAGCDFSTAPKMGLAESGNIENADSLAGFDEITSDVAKRLLRNQKGLLEGLKKRLRGSHDSFLRC